MALTAVELEPWRMEKIESNLQRLGYSANLICADASNLEAWWDGEHFDKILLDAPCSSEGLVRKDFDALKNWSNSLVEKKAILQKKLLKKCFQLLKKNGTLVYSTCSLSPEENEEVVQSVFEKGNCEIEKFELRGFILRKGMTEYKNKKFSKEIENCVRIYPQDNDSQAFFFAKIKKTAT